ncbi:MAG: phosphoglycolate phosphatase [Burkholderiales bacterium]|nr:MAG: phosphoglycolate phosphatase [Burkholderiales bacterium]
MPYDLVLFDLDGTLIETAPEIADAVNDTLRRFDLDPVSQQQVNNWIGHGTRELLIQALAFTGRTTTDAVRHADSFRLIEAEFAVFYARRCGTRSRLYPRVRESLQALREAGVKLAVVTNKEGRYTETVLRAHDLLEVFDRVISGDTLPVKKPDPAGIQDCLQRFGVTRERTLFVGDSSIDVATARNAGVTVWVLPYGYNMGQPIEACGADRVIPDFSALTTG